MGRSSSNLPQATSRMLGLGPLGRLGWVTPFASTELALKHTRNKLYMELVLQELALQE